MLLATKESFAKALEALVRKFDSDLQTYTSQGYGEAQARSHFITPFFKALGWDVENEAGVPYHLCEVWEEKGETEGRPDYTFRLNGQTKFFIEAKAPSSSLATPPSILQTKSYAWSSRDVLLAGLTHFEEFRFFDASLEPDERRLLDGQAFHFQYTEYLDNLDLLWELSPQRVAAGSLDRFLRRDRKSIRYRIPVDKRFLDELTEWRRDLASNIHRLNADLDIRELNDIVQRLLDRIVFIRIAEERKVIEPGQLRELVELWEQRGGKVPIIQDLVGLFSQINEDFNGEIFKPHPSERVRIDSSVLVRIIRRLYPPKSPYRFDVIGVELLGSIYERYLGNTLQLFPIKWLDASEFVLPPDLDPKYIVALLNSKLLDWYLKKISVRAYQTAFMYVRKYIEQLPIKLPNGKSGDPPEHDLILEKVEKIIQLTSRAVATKDVSANEQQIRAADRAIDTLVYKLYDLTDEQVGIVEGAG